MNRVSGRGRKTKSDYKREKRRSGARFEALAYKESRQQKKNSINKQNYDYFVQSKLVT